MARVIRTKITGTPAKPAATPPNNQFTGNRRMRDYWTEEELAKAKPFGIGIKGPGKYIKPPEYKGKGGSKSGGRATWPR